MPIPWSTVKRIVKDGLNQCGNPRILKEKMRKWFMYALMESSSPEEIGVFRCAASVLIGLAVGLYDKERQETHIRLLDICRAILSEAGYQLEITFEIKSDTKEAHLLSLAFHEERDELIDQLQDLCE